MLQNVVASPLLRVARLDGVGRLAAHTAVRCITTANKDSALSRSAAYAMQSPRLSAAGLRTLAKLDVGAPRDRYLGRITP